MSYDGPHSGCGPQCEYGCYCGCHKPIPEIPSKVDEIAKKGEAQLAKHTPLDYVPDFHSYYWLGWRDAVKAIKEAEKK
jgi:hypothetical protein